MTAKTPTSLTGAAGEYFTAAELSMRGWLATVTIKNAPGTDVLARHLASGQQVSIQTKTASGAWFRLNTKDEALGDTSNEWYVLVQLHEVGQRPDFFVLPRIHLSAILTATRREFLARRNKDTTQLSVSPGWVGGYREKWELLEAGRADTPYLGDDSRWDLIQQFGVSDGHPWASRLPSRSHSVLV